MAQRNPQEREEEVDSFFLDSTAFSVLEEERRRSRSRLIKTLLACIAVAVAFGAWVLLASSIRRPH